MKIGAIAFSLALCILALDCGGSVSQAQPPKQDPNLTLDLMLGSPAAPERAAAEFVKERLPKATIHGITSIRYQSTAWVVGVDLSAPASPNTKGATKEARTTFNFLVRLYDAPDKKQYWRAEAMTGENTKLLPPIPMNQEESGRLLQQVTTWLGTDAGKK